MCHVETRLNVRTDGPAFEVVRRDKRDAGHSLRWLSSLLSCTAHHTSSHSSSSSQAHDHYSQIERYYSSFCSFSTQTRTHEGGAFRGALERERHTHTHQHPPVTDSPSLAWPPSASVNLITVAVFFPCVQTRGVWACVTRHPTTCLVDMAILRHRLFPYSSHPLLTAPPPQSLLPPPPHTRLQYKYTKSTPSCIDAAAPKIQLNG